MYRTKTGTDSKLLTAQEFIDVEDIAEGIIYSKSGYLFGFLQVHASSSQLLDEYELIARAESVTRAVSTTGSDPIQIIAVPKTIDTMGMISNLVALRRETNADAKLRLINGEISTLQDMAREGTKEPMIVIKCWAKAARGADKQLVVRLRELCSRLSENSVNASVMDNPSVIYLCKLFADLTEYHASDDDVFEDIPILPGSRRLFTKRSGIQEDSEILRNLITPIGGLAFDVSRVYIGAVTGRVYAAMRYPSELEYGWAVELMNASDCVTSLTYYPGNASTLGDALSSSIHRSASEASSVRDARARKRLERQAQDAEKLIEEMDFKNSAIGHVSILAMPFSSDAAAFEDVCKIVSNRFAKKKIKIKPLGNIQKEAFKSITPYHIPDSTVEEITKQIMPLESLLGGFPMTISIFRDDKGCYFGKTTDGGIISLDMRFRGRDRTNGHMVVTGLAGQGKSTALKHITESQYMTGTKCLIIDPEREYKDLCMGLGGAWLDVGGGTAKINPLQIRPAPEDEDDEDETLYKTADNAMAAHLRTAEAFFSLLLPTLDGTDKALLKDELIILYNSCNIYWDTDVSKLSAEQFPILEQLYRQTAERAKTLPRLEKLSILLRDLAVGADSFLFNGYTSINLNSDFIVFDTNRIGSSSDNLKRAQYFNVLTLVWELMSADKTEPVLALCDEAHMMFEPSVLQTAMFLRNMAKRGRKYEGQLFTVTQSVSDILFPEVRLYGQAILDNATYKLIFGCDGKNLQDTAEIFKLTEQEKRILLARNRGRALMLAGNQHLDVQFDIPKYKLELMGTGGGR